MRSESLVYLTYGDVDSPVYQTQVIGFCKFLHEELEVPTVLVAFVPLRMYFAERRAIKRYNISCKIFPVINRWQDRPWYSKLNAWLLGRVKAASVMTRNPVAANVCVALQAKGWNYFYDARGCQYKELEEFSDATATEVQRMLDLELRSFKSADWVYAVSQSLVTHFKQEHAYRDHNHSVVPCCHLPAKDDSPRLTKQELFGSDDVTVFCYAGALSVWNFPRSFLELCSEVLKHENYRLIILSKQIDRLDEYAWLHNERTHLASVSHDEVRDYLRISDYGILLRKTAFTNRVASPSKFADYLAAGCKLVISPEVGDFTDMVEEHELGIVYKGRKDNQKLANLQILKDEERAAHIELALQRFVRSSELNRLKYRNLKRLHEGV